ncbi:MAG: serine hydrolase domain-containing protein, partial [Planctomycetota bacterium]
MSRLLTFAACVCLSILTIRPTSAEDSADLQTKIQQLAQAYVDGDSIRSAAIGVINGEDEFFVGVGQLSESDSRQPNRQTIYEIGSISKVFTGVLLADAIKRDLVRAEQAVQELLPKGVTMPTWKDKGTRLITLKDLSTHASGLPRMPNNIKIFNNPTNPYVDYKADDLFEFLKSHELRREPGTQEEYSNLAVGLLGELLAQNQDTDYESLLKSRITDPLGMSDTTLTLSDEQRKRLAPPHDVSNQPASNWDFKAMAGAGAIRSNVDDMLKFCRANLTPPKNDVGNALNLAYQQQRDALGGSSRPMGFGWMINPGTSTHWHNG